MSDEQPVSVERDGRVVVLTLDRPDRMNAISPAMADAVVERLDRAEADDDVGAVVLTGAGRGFCSGADLAELAAQAGAAAGDDGGVPGPATTRRVMRGRWSRLAERLVEFEKPLVCAVNGAAAGAGASIAVAGDVTLVADHARIAFVFVHRGLVPDYAATWLLPRLVGLRQARRLCLTGEAVDAEQAVALGLADEVVAADQLAERAVAVAHQLADGPGVALQLTKRLLAESAQHSAAEHIEREFTYQSVCFATDDAMEGMRAFMEKREPRFRSR